MSWIREQERQFEMYYYNTLKSLISGIEFKPNNIMETLKGKLVKQEKKWYVATDDSLIQVAYSCLKRIQLKEGDEVDGYVRIKHDPNSGSDFNVFVITSNEIIPRPYLSEEAYIVTINILEAYNTKTLNRIINKLTKVIIERKGNK